MSLRPAVASEGPLQTQRYSLATICRGVALAVAWPIDAPSSCFLLAVTVSSLFGGLGRGLFSVALSSLAFDYFLLRRTPSYRASNLLAICNLPGCGIADYRVDGEKRRVDEPHNRTEEALRQAQADLAQVNRVSTMRELTASLAQEVNQPIAAAITDANRCLRWVTRDYPDLEKARQAASRVVKDVTRAPEIVNRVRLLIQERLSAHWLI